MILLAMGPNASMAGQHEDADVIAKIKATDPVINAIFSECTDEHLARSTKHSSEFFTYTAKCTLKKSLDACEREQIKIYGDFEGDWTPYDTQLHLLCMD